MKTSEKDVKYGSFNMGEMDKSRELYSREGDNSSEFEGKQCRGNTLWDDSAFVWVICVFFITVDDIFKTLNHTVINMAAAQRWTDVV